MRAVRMEWGDILFSLRRSEAKDGSAIDGNGMAGIGRKNLASGDFAAPSGGSGISGCRAGGTGKVQRERTIRLQFLAAGRGGKIVLHGAGDEVYFVVRGTDLAALADALQVISGDESGFAGLCGGRSWPARDG